MPIRKIKIVDLQKPDLSQSRVSTDPETIAKYKVAWESGNADFPEVVIYQDGEKYHIADGFHRVQSLMHADLKQKVEHRTIACDVRSGTIADAIRYALTANDRHGLRPNIQDKKRSLLLYWGLLPINSRLSNNAVSKVCGVSHTFVGSWKATCINTPIAITAAETKIPVEVLEQTIANLKAAQAEGKIVTTRNGEPLVQSLKVNSKALCEEPKTIPREHLLLPAKEEMVGLQISSKALEPDLYIVTTTASLIPRGTVIEGFESLTDTGNIVCNWQLGTDIIPSGDLIKIPYPIDDKVTPIHGETEHTVTGYALVADDLKIQSIDKNGFACTHSSTMLKPYQPKKSSTDDEDKPTPPILDLTVLTTKQLREIIAVIGTEIYRRASLPQDMSDLTVC